MFSQRFPNVFTTLSKRCRSSQRKWRSCALHFSAATSHEALVLGSHVAHRVSCKIAVRSCLSSLAQKRTLPTQNHFLCCRMKVLKLVDHFAIRMAKISRKQEMGEGSTKVESMITCYTFVCSLLHGDQIPTQVGSSWPSGHFQNVFRTFL